jgi:hypothetical protein
MMMKEEKETSFSLQMKKTTVDVAVTQSKQFLVLEMLQF